MRTVTMETLRMPPKGWMVELELPQGTTVAELKAKLAAFEDGPKITNKTKVLNKSGSTIYTLMDAERATARMLLTDPSQEGMAEEVRSPERRQPTSKSVPSAPLRPTVPSSKSVPFSQTQPTMPVSPGTVFSFRPQLPKSTFSGVGRAKMASPPEAGIPASSTVPAELAAFASKLPSMFLKQYDDSTDDESPAPQTDRSLAAAQAILRDQEESYTRSFSSGEIVPAMREAIRIYGTSPNHFRTPEKGTIAINDYMLVIAGYFFAANKPVLAKHGFSSSVQGLARLMQVIVSFIHVEAVGNAFFINLCKFLFIGDGTTGSMTPGETSLATLVGMAVMTGTMPLLLSFTTWIQHLATCPMDRRSRTLPRTIAWIDLLFTEKLIRLRKAAHRGGVGRTVWVLGARGGVEGILARDGRFAEANFFKEADLTICLVGDDISQNWVNTGVTKVTTHTWQELENCSLPEPAVIFLPNSGLGTLDGEIVRKWLPRYARALVVPSAVVVSTSRSETEAQGEAALLEYIGGANFLRENSEPVHVRNLFSAMAGNPDVDFDEGGWFVAYTKGKESNPIELSCNTSPAIDFAKQKLERPDAQESSESGDVQAHAPEEEPKKGKGKDPAVFWGILDLKYDSSLHPSERVKVLETGDGQSSKFSGYGAAIKDAFMKDHKLEETIHRAVMTENKKLTHDTIVEYGYAHLRPKQAVFPMVYAEDLAEQICRELGLDSNGMCVLKLCNRSRGAGVVPVNVADLDMVLANFLQPPEDVETWLLEQPENWPYTVASGSFEEQARHWWSNECPIFIAEEMRMSATTEQDGRHFDGTMRVGFLLTKKLREDPECLDDTSEGGCYENPTKDKTRQKFWNDDRTYIDLFRPGEVLLRTRWLGGYWKLPLQDVQSKDLRGKIVSVAKQGTAPVSQDHLHDVYACLGDVVSLLYNPPANSLSHRNLNKRYGNFPEFSAFVCSRLAASMRWRDRRTSANLLQLTRLQVCKLTGGPKQAVLSYIERNDGIYEGMHLRWEKAEPFFREAVKAMPTNASAIYLLGMARMELKYPDEAAVHFKNALQLDPDFKAPYVNLGVALLRLSRFQESVEACEAGLARHPVTAHASYNLALAATALAIKAERENAGQIDQAALRSKALQGLESARETRQQQQLWSVIDEKMLVALSTESTLIPLMDELPLDGWRSYYWRP